MNSTAIPYRQSPLTTLRRLAKPRVAAEFCELCRVDLSAGHRHLLEMKTRNIVCACDGCALRFQAVDGGRFKLIPRDACALPDFQMTDAQWESLAIPINLAFFFHNSTSGKLSVLYPSPAGATESLLPLLHWEELIAANSCLNEMQPDVEALLVNRVNNAREHFIAPIDTCFELVGLIRMYWRGLSGGDAVWREIGIFFKSFNARATRDQTTEVSHA